MTSRKTLEKRIEELEGDSGAGDDGLVVTVVRRGIDDEPGTGVHYKARWGRDGNGEFVEEVLES